MSDGEFTIVTNGHHRDILDGWDLTPEEREQFDYIDWEKVEKGEESASFFRYRGEIYDLSEFEWTGTLMSGGVLATAVKQWDGFLSDSFFSGVLVRYVDDYEGVVVGTYFA
jgi:hypothetical protein